MEASSHTSAAAIAGSIRTHCFRYTPSDDVRFKHLNEVRFRFCWRRAWLRHRRGQVLLWTLAGRGC